MFFISYDRDGWDGEKGWSDSIFVNWVVCDLRVHLVVAGGSPVTTEPRGGISFGGITLSNDICDEDVGLCINVCREVALFNCDCSECSGRRNVYSGRRRYLRSIKKGRRGSVSSVDDCRVGSFCADGDVEGSFVEAAIL